MELDFNLLSPQHINYETSFKTKFKVEWILVRWLFSDTVSTAMLCSALCCEHYYAR
jgi:hypothetical protein